MMKFGSAMTVSFADARRLKRSNCQFPAGASLDGHRDADPRTGRIAAHLADQFEHERILALEAGRGAIDHDGAAGGRRRAMLRRHWDLDAIDRAVATDIRHPEGAGRAVGFSAGRRLLTEDE